MKKAFVVMTILTLLVITGCSWLPGTNGGDGADGDLTNYYTKTEIIGLLLQYVKYNIGTDDVSVDGTVQAAAFVGDGSGLTGIGGGGDTGWQTPTLLNNWNNLAGYSTCQYRKDAMGFVHIKGVVKSLLDASVNKPVFALPDIYKPSDTLNKLFGAISNNTLGKIEIKKDTDTIWKVFILSPANKAWVSLDGITFYAGN